MNNWHAANILLKNSLKSKAELKKTLVRDSILTNKLSSNGVNLTV